MRRKDRNIELFYDSVSEYYDEMTGFQKRFDSERKNFQNIIQKFKIKFALDAGCGTGFHSLLLSELGVSLTAADVSSRMIKLLDKHAGERNKKIKTIQSDFISLPIYIKTKFDAVFCLGNSMPHLSDKKNFNATLKSFFSILKPGGVLIIQQLNYNKILKKKERIISIKETDKNLFIRFYDFEKKLINFNILKVEKELNTFKHSLQTITLHPWLKSDYDIFLKNTGF